ncbi:DinB family protein [Paenibacillus oenotherae]|uniref:DinB family protein n=1 Tax=Paenibacillus oenotherae TaxID=1435645 RepID=A0ABS7D669_9BACL|nr:DinB family protein [Paenibacillus oenotherae]MBW7474653.1 DinB family protein [Paenibacillus oenotherae]
MSERPESNEYLPLAEKYISLVPDGTLPHILQRRQEDTIALLAGLSEEQAGYRYAEGKWSLKQVVGHIADVERLWSYRILRIARGDVHEFHGYDRDVFNENSPFGDMPLAEVLNDYSAVRQSTITLVGGLTQEALLRLGEFGGSPLSARAAAYVIAGHDIHHMNVIAAKYLIK